MAHLFTPKFQLRTLHELSFHPDWDRMEHDVFGQVRLFMIHAAMRIPVIRMKNLFIHIPARRWLRCPAEMGVRNARNTTFRLFDCRRHLPGVWKPAARAETTRRSNRRG